MMRRIAALLALLIAQPARAEALRGGGLVLFLRHADTGYPWPDQARAGIGDCDTQRDLNEAGREQARAIGAAVRAASVPVATVLASPFCRTMETATLAFGRATPEPALALPRHTGDAAAHRAMGDAFRALIPHLPAPGGNLVLVGHSYHVLAATGVRLEPQGAALVLRPEGPGRFAVLGVIRPDGWRQLDRLAEAR